MEILLHRQGREKVWTKVCMLINFIPMISGLHNQHLTNTNAQTSAKHSETLKLTWKWPNRLFTWQLANGSPLFAKFVALPTCASRLCRGNPESLSDNASAFSSRAKQLHRRMWWRDMKVRRSSHPCDPGQGLSSYAAHMVLFPSTDEADYCPGSVCPSAHHHKWVFG